MPSANHTKTSFCGLCGLEGNPKNKARHKKTCTGQSLVSILKEYDVPEAHWPAESSALREIPHIQDVATRTTDMVKCLSAKNGTELLPPLDDILMRLATRLGNSDLRTDFTFTMLHHGEVVSEEVALEQLRSTFEKSAKLENLKILDFRGLPDSHVLLNPDEFEAEKERAKDYCVGACELRSPSLRELPVFSMNIIPASGIIEPHYDENAHISVARTRRSLAGPMCGGVRTLPPVAKVWIVWPRLKLGEPEPARGKADWQAEGICFFLQRDGEYVVMNANVRHCVITLNDCWLGGFLLDSNERRPPDISNDIENGATEEEAVDRALQYFDQALKQEDERRLSQFLTLWPRNVPKIRTLRRTWDLKHCIEKHIISSGACRICESLSQRATEEIRDPKIHSQKHVDNKSII